MTRFSRLVYRSRRATAIICAALLLATVIAPVSASDYDAAADFGMWLNRPLDGVADSPLVP